MTQLFKTRAVDIPYSTTRSTEGCRIFSQHISSFPFMYWPDWMPCDPVNMYFLDIAHQATGDSLKTYASQLSHLIRYCSKKNVAIGQLCDKHIFELTGLLLAEKSPRKGNERARNNNTVRDILSRIIQFLLWYQVHFVSTASTPLIGIDKESPQIRVKRMKNPMPGRKRTDGYYLHHAMPPPESRDPKHPIALPIIEDIEKCIDALSRIESQSARTLQRFPGRLDLLAGQLEYVRQRRHFMVWMMKRTGLRPAEMVGINVTDHADILHQKRLIIPTKKRRRDKDPLRNFPIALKDATIFLRYLTGRNNYYAVLRKFGLDAPESDALFLGVNGEPIKKSSLERDFSRLVKAAGHSDIQACFSMFRHRFITYEVLTHLKEFMTSTNKTPQLMTDTDYASILKRVATKTGHGSIESLWHYIDLAWKEIDVWGGVDKAIDRLHAADRLFEDLLELKHEIKECTALGTKQIVDMITSRLSTIIETNKRDLINGSE